MCLAAPLLREVPARPVGRSDGGACRLLGKGQRVVVAPALIRNSALRESERECRVGISTRQHNGSAGNQDVWHYHLHVFPRYPNDGLYAGEKVAYATEERIALAARIRAALM